MKEYVWYDQEKDEIFIDNLNKSFQYAFSDLLGQCVYLGEL
jgi:hypothetical protein